MIYLSGVTFSYRKNESLFNDLSLELESGKVIGLLGKNGAGKSTLIQLMCGLLFPKQGDLKMDGFTPHQRVPTFLADLFLLPEVFHVPPLNLSQYEYHMSPFYPKFDHNLFEKVIEEFDLPRKRKLTTFSHGQQKKALIAFGLASRTKLLILDEPTNGLDIPSKTQFRNMLMEAMDESRTFLVSTHQVRDMQTIINDFLIIDGGQVLFHESSSEIKRKLNFDRASKPPADVLFQEQEGSYCRFISKGPTKGNIDLELLFNAVVLKDEKTSAALKEKSTEITQ